VVVSAQEVTMERSIGVALGREHSQKWSVAYWALTSYVSLTSIGAGVGDILRLQPLVEVFQHLGYPPHFVPLLGIWKVLGGVALLAPRYPLVKEWAYAGLFVDYTAALVAHAAVGDAAYWLIGPTLALACMIGSWWLRPASRRLAAIGGKGSANVRA
jgi:DoxX-like family